MKIFNWCKICLIFFFVLKAALFKHRSFFVDKVNEIRGELVLLAGVKEFWEVNYGVWWKQQLKCTEEPKWLQWRGEVWKYSLSGFSIRLHWGCSTTTSLPYVEPLCRSPEISKARHSVCTHACVSACTFFVCTEAVWSQGGCCILGIQ